MAVSTTARPVTLTEYDEHLQADRGGQEKVSSAVRDIQATRWGPYA